MNTTYNYFVDLITKAETLTMVCNINPDDQIVRSIYRKADKVYRGLTQQEKGWADDYMYREIPFH